MVLNEFRSGFDKSSDLVLYDKSSDLVLYDNSSDLVCMIRVQIWF